MSLVTVLSHPQDLVNVASVIRVMKNFGLRDLRLVAPAEYDERRIEGIAHGSADVLKRVAMFDDLSDAIADCTCVVGMTARQRAAKRSVLRPRQAAQEILREAAAGKAAILLGPEDRGLSNDELDRCHRLVTIPTSRYQALNLSHAFAVMAYELHVTGGAGPLKLPRRRAPAAPVTQLELLFADAERALDAIEFFKTRNPEHVMRTVRDVVHRTPLDAREAKLLRAMCLEVVRYLERAGVR